MIEPFLKSQLEPVARRQRLFRLSRDMAFCWAGAGMVALIFLLAQRLTGWMASWVLPAIGTITALGAFWVWLRSRRGGPDFRQIAREIEQRHPELHALLLTAVEQRPDAVTGQYHFLQERVIREAILESMKGGWLDTISPARLIGMQLVQVAMFVFLLSGLTGLRVQSKQAAAGVKPTRVHVTPGDALVERGNGLAVLARFEGPLPAEVTMVLRPDGQMERQVPLAKSLNDPVFGGTIPEVTNTLTYHVTYGPRRSEDFKVQVFEYPRLERADAHFAFPAYTGLPEKTVQDTRRVSAVEGATLDLSLQLNKPVASAQLITKDKTIINLAAETNRATALLSKFPMRKSQTYELVLIDAAGRTNKLATQLVVEVLTNRTPELKFLAPRGDQRVSALEEINFQAEVWDDFGVKNYGLTYSLGGTELKTISFGKDVPAREKRQFGKLLGLEDLAAKPDQLLSYFIWADDIGPDGQSRRSASDMYYAEVRPYDEIFREAQSSPESESEQQGGQGGELMKLAELQKQIINATWKLQRDNRVGMEPEAARPAKQSVTPAYSSDVKVVEQSQQDALKQANEKKADSQSAQAKALWDTVEKEMGKAGDLLSSAQKTPEPLPGALAAEQGAYQALLKLAAHEYRVGQRRRGGGQGGSQQNQRQMDQLELTQSENRYENQKQASGKQNPAQQEQLQVSNRLKELSQRQQDLNERLKELQTALQEAKSEQEREEIRRRLKRLREEEQQMLADVDELLQRMDRPDNQSRMAEARQQLEQTRNQVQRTAENIDKEAVGQALSSGTRAQRELQDLREDLRKKNSAQFAEDMRQMRSEARDLAQKEEKLGEKLQSLADAKRKTLSDSGDTQKLLGQMDQQKGKMTNLLEQMTRVSQEAESSEPLLSKQLYDTLRKASQGNADQALQKSGELLKLSLFNEAGQFEQRARQEINQVKQGVERAAESVLGDEAEALRLARSELDDLARQVDKEIAAQEKNKSGNGQQAAAGQPQNPNGQPAPQPGGNNAGSESQAQEGKNPGEQPAPGESNKAGQSPGQNGQANSQPKPGQSGGSQSASAQPGQTPSSQQSSSQQSGQPGQNAQANGSGQGGAPQGGPGQTRPSDQAQQGRARQRASLSGEPRPGQQTPENEPQQGRGGNRTAGGGGGEGGEREREEGVITGEGYGEWSDRLRNVEEMLDLPDVRDEVAGVRERARAMRTEFKKQSKPPQWSVVRSQIAQPLAELRSRINEELARRESKDSLVPIDRDPVPQRYSELVRRYYEKLGSSEPSTPPQRP